MKTILQVSLKDCLSELFKESKKKFHIHIRWYSLSDSPFVTGTPIATILPQSGVRLVIPFCLEDCHYPDWVMRIYPEVDTDFAKRNIIIHSSQIEIYQTINGEHIKYISKNVEDDKKIFNILLECGWKPQ